MHALCLILMHVKHFVMSNENCSMVYQMKSKCNVILGHIDPTLNNDKYILADNDINIVLLFL